MHDVSRLCRRLAAATRQTVARYPEGFLNNSGSFATLAAIRRAPFRFDPDQSAG